MVHRRGQRSNWLLRMAPLAVVATLLTACGGSGGGSGGTTGSASTSPDGPAVPTTDTPVTFGVGSGGTSPAITGPVADSGERPDRLPVRAESADSPLPEVVVRHLQGAAWVQLKNALPADRAVLVWFWAPH